MNTNEAAVSVLQYYIDEHLFEPRSNWPKDFFRGRSYSRWAAYELQGRIIEESLRLPPHLTITCREQKTPIEIIVEFISEMDYFLEMSEMNGNRRSQFIFSVAKETAKEIIDLFL